MVMVALGDPGAPMIFCANAGKAVNTTAIRMTAVVTVSDRFLCCMSCSFRLTLTSDAQTIIINAL
jgi:hypothetical protein